MKMPGALAMLVAGLAVFSIDAHAQNCTFSSSINFGTIDPSAAPNTNLTGVVNYNCSGFATPYAKTCAHLAYPTTRFMTGPGGAKLNFDLYVDPSRSMRWGSYSDGLYPLELQIALSGGAAMPSKGYYGTVFGNQSGLAPGSYTINMTGNKLWSIGYSGSPPTCAGTTNSTFQLTVSATVASSCTVSATNIAFGQLGLLLSAATTTGVVTTTCANTTPYTLSLNVGLGSGATFANRRLTRSGGSETLAYRLYRDSGRTQVWGDGSGGSTTVTGTGTGSPQTATVYAELPVPGASPPGTYNDTITVTVTF